MRVILETERLQLRAFTLDDAPFIVQLLNTPGWLQFIGDRNVRTETQAVQYLQQGPLESYRQHGYGLWVVEKKEDQTAIGLCGILKRDTLDHPDLGFAFLPEFGGQGYAAEAARATLQYAKGKLNLPAVWAIALPTNARSIRLLEKIGLRFVKMHRLPGGTDALCLYSS